MNETRSLLGGSGATASHCGDPATGARQQRAHCIRDPAGSGNCDWLVGHSFGEMRRCRMLSLTFREDCIRYSFAIFTTNSVYSQLIRIL
jgi:hypothetical protein